MELEKAFKKLIITDPFYGLFCLNLPKRISTDVETLCVEPVGVNVGMCINPNFWKTLSDLEQIAVLKHEIGHIMFQHMFMSKSFSCHELFNISADLEVNSYIEHLPSGALLPKLFNLEPKLGTKVYYEKLKEQGAGQETSGQGSIDDHSKWKAFEECSDAYKQLISNTINASIKRVAEDVVKGRGTVPAEFSEIVQKLTEKRPEIFNWRAYFRRLLGSVYDINIRLTRRKPSKRFEGSAGVKHKKKVSILIAVDTSGSISTRELQEFFAEIHHIYKAGARITILECDAQINKVVEYNGTKIPEIVGRGGTSFDPPMEYYVKHRKEYASLIYFTDGECSLPKLRPTGVIWVITSNGMHQDYFGKTIFIPKDINNG